jgi:hypothetical protein
MNWFTLLFLCKKTDDLAQVPEWGAGDKPMVGFSIVFHLREKLAYCRAF